MFEGFERFTITQQGVAIRGVHHLHPSLPPLLLLHGYPQSHLIWHRVAPRLIDRFSLVIPDLRGYGASDKPPGGADHSGYAKRVMASDQLGVMQALGFEHFGLCGHDRGARVGHRLAVDHPRAVRRLMLLDISPTLTMYEGTDRTFAEAYWHWFFLIQPAPFPETMIGAAPEAFLARKTAAWGSHAQVFAPEAYAAYLAGIRDPATVHAMCEDYRAAATIDLEHDRADRAAGVGLACPVRVLWGERGVVHRCFSPVRDWRAVTDPGQPVSGRSVPGGHYIPEELPDLLADEIVAFFG
jgi:haloacetate dehalogenase